VEIIPALLNGKRKESLLTRGVKGIHRRDPR